MGARQATWAALAAVCLLPTQVAASVVMEPVARLALEGGYDSNPAYDGSGGSQMGRVSPDVGLQLRDHTWAFSAGYGADLYAYPSSTVDQRSVNHRGRVLLDSRLTDRTELKLDGRIWYAADSIGLAQLGYVNPAGDTLIWRGDAKLSWRSTPRTTLAATLFERAATIQGDGVALHAPGAEVAWRLDERTDLGASYRYDAFQSIGAVPDQGTAHEALAFARWRWTRRLRLEGEAGPGFWQGPRGSTVVPVAALTLLASDRPGDVRITARHGIGINALARASLMDSIEFGFAWRIVRNFALRGDGGFWHGGLLPDGAGATTGYGAASELVWLARRGLEIGIAASRYARIDTATPATRRNQIGLRVAWQLENH